MNGYERRPKWAHVLVVVLVSVLVGIVGYSVGVSHGLAQSGVAGADAYPYGWHRPWGFGFFFPMLFVVLWFTLLRGFWWGWGGPWGWGGAPWRHRYYAGPRDAPPSFDEWHRRAHEHMKETRSADPS